MYEIEFDRQHGVIEATLSGMMSMDEVAAYIADIKRIFVLHQLRTYSMVIDVSGCPIQHQDMVQAMAAHMASMPKASSLAVVTGSSLARMQIRRLFKQPYARIVSTIEEGRRWVISGLEPALQDVKPSTNCADRASQEDTTTLIQGGTAA